MAHLKINNLQKGFEGFDIIKGIDLEAVSYTHLTLPTTPYV